MLRQRTITILVLLPIGLMFTFLGGIYFTLFVAVTLGLAAWEFTNLFSIGSYKPASIITILGVFILALWQGLNPAIELSLLISILILISITYHVWMYERGSETAAIDFTITVAGWMYIGWLGTYIIALRNLPDGVWWFLLVLPAVWFSDVAAYMIGFILKTHPVGLRTSPNKTWEGFISSYIGGILGGILLALLWQIWGAPITMWQGAVTGFVLSVLAPLGDLGVSLIKRQFKVKDTGNLLPGHGGILDRIDSWLWAGVIGYYLITWFFI